MFSFFKKRNNNNKKRKDVFDVEDEHYEEELSDGERNEPNPPPPVVAAGAPLKPIPSKLKKPTAAGASPLQARLAAPVPAQVVDKDLDEQFAKLLDDLAFPAAKRQAMMKVSNERKAQLIKQHASSGAATNNKDPASFIEPMKNQPIENIKAQLLSDLRIALETQPVTWVEEFVSLGGTEILLSILNEKHRKSKRSKDDKQIQTDCIYCVKALMNAKSTLTKFLSIPDSITALSLCLNWKDVQLKIMILELLTTVCMLPNGHRLVIAGLSALKKNGIEKFRFSTLLVTLKKSKSDELKLIVMSFINAIVNSPSDIDVRAHLRTEFERRGLKQIIQSLSELIDSSPNSSILTDLEIQINIYEEESSIDESDLLNRLSTLNCTNFDSTEALLQSLITRTENYGLSNQFVRLLQSLLLLPVPEASEGGYECWDLAGRIVSEIALKKEEISVDDTSGFKLSLSDLASGIGELNIIQKSNPKDDAQLTKLRGKISMLESKIEGSEDVKSELDRSEKERLKLEQSFQALKKKYDHAQEEILTFNVAKHNAAKNQAPELPPPPTDITLSAPPLPPVPSLPPISADFLPPPLPSLPPVLDVLAPPLPLLPSLPTDLPPSLPSLPPELPSLPAPPTISAALPPLPSTLPSLPDLPPIPASQAARSDADEKQISELQAKINELSNTISSLQQQLSSQPSGSSVSIIGGLPELPSVPNPSMEGGLDDIPLPPGMEGEDGGPPPPPPPPGLGVPGGAPPPPGSGPPGGPTKAAAPPGRSIKVKPKNKLKGFQWAALNTTKTKGTIWDTLDANHHIEFNFSEIEKVFTAEPPPDANKGRKIGRGKQGEAGKDSSEVVEIVKVHLIEDRKVRNVEIMLARLGKGIPFNLIKKAILQMNEDLVEPATLQIIHDFYPTDDELEGIRNFEATPTQVLGDAERFFLEIGEIPNLKERIKLQLFKIRFPEKASGILPELNAVRRASRGLLKSDSWKVILENVLLLGNFINFGTFRGGAYGFKLSSLLKMSDTKGASGQTLLHVLVKEMESRNAEEGSTINGNANLFEDLKYCESAMKVSMTSLRGEMKQLKDGMAELVKGIEMVGDSDLPGDKWLKTMQNFRMKTEKMVKTLDNEFTLTEKNFLEVLKWFGEDVGEAGANKVEPEEMFGLVWKFKSDFERVKAEMKRKKMQEKQAEERAAAREKRKMDLEIKKLVAMEMSGEGRAVIDEDEVEEAVVDDILDNLREGDVFRNRREKREKKGGAARKRNRRREALGGNSSESDAVDEAFADFTS